jgi:hypothetical protein
MADPILLLRIKEQHLVAIGHRNILPHPPHIHTAIGKHDMRRLRALTSLSCLQPPAQWTSLTATDAVLNERATWIDDMGIPA